MRLKAVVSNPVNRAPDDKPLPYYALEHIESGTGRLLPGTVIEDKVDESAVLHRPGDVRFGKLRPYLAKALLMEDEGSGSGELLVLRSEVGIDCRFLAYLAISRPFVGWATATSYGVKMPRTNWSALGSFQLDLASTESQRRITKHLDGATARIDELVAEQETQVLLVRERQRSFLVSAVFGSERREATRPVPELGGIPVPQVWPVARHGSLNCEIQTGPFGSQLHQHDYVDDGFPVINPANLHHGRIRATSGMCVDEATRARLSRHVLQPGDIVFGRRGEMGRAGLVGDDEAGWLCGTGSLRIRFREQIFENSYLKRILEADVIKQHLEATSVGTTMDNLNSGIVARIPIPVPPSPVQREICRVVDEHEAEVDHLVRELEGQIGLLREHRQALITHAVTQGIDGLPGVA